MEVNKTVLRPTAANDPQLSELQKVNIVTVSFTCATALYLCVVSSRHTRLRHVLFTESEADLFVLIDSEAELVILIDRPRNLSRRRC